MTQQTFSELRNQFPEKFSEPKFDENSELKELSDSFHALVYKSRIEDEKGYWEKIDEIFNEVQNSINIYQKLQHEKIFINKNGTELAQKNIKYDIFMNVLFFCFALICFFNFLSANITIFLATAIIIFYLHHKLSFLDFFSQTTILNAIYNFEINRIINDISLHGFHERTLKNFTKYKNSIYDSSLSECEAEKAELFLEIQESILRLKILEKIDPSNNITESSDYRFMTNLSYANY
jgi:hypothetical protein